jgi:hypothetical protein
LLTKVAIAIGIALSRRSIFGNVSMTAAAIDRRVRGSLDVASVS